MDQIPTRQEAWELFLEYNQNEHLQKHALTVESVMRHFGEKNGENAELWGIVGLLHDIDYEKFPDEHCAKAKEILEAHNYPSVIIRAVQSHGYGLCSQVLPESQMEKTLYTIDELSGLIYAACLLRPSKSVLDVDVKSIMKKYKSKSFAAGVNREVIQKGCDMLQMDLADVIAESIAGMQNNAETIGLKGNL